MRVAGPLRRTPALILATSALAGATAGPAKATNGFNSLGFGLEALATAGAGWQLGPDLRLGLAVEYLLPNEVTHDNPELPFGPDARARVSYVALHVGLSWRL